MVLWTCAECGTQATTTIAVREPAYPPDMWGVPMASTGQQGLVCDRCWRALETAYIKAHPYVRLRA